ncbi:MAG: hypothetical protein M3O22_04565 [Pseudomonadota bacterium]|nr:hypothetical protein [Pseudomonadota bacterium]
MKRMLFLSVVLLCAFPALAAEYPRVSFALWGPGKQVWIPLGEFTDLEGPMKERKINTEEGWEPDPLEGLPVHYIRNATEGTKTVLPHWEQPVILQPGKKPLPLKNIRMIEGEACAAVEAGFLGVAEGLKQPQEGYGVALAVDAAHVKAAVFPVDRTVQLKPEEQKTLWQVLDTLMRQQLDAEIPRDVTVDYMKRSFEGNPAAEEEAAQAMKLYEGLVSGSPERRLELGLAPGGPGEAPVLYVRAGWFVGDRLGWAMAVVVPQGPDGWNFDALKVLDSLSGFSDGVIGYSMDYDNFSHLEMVAVIDGRTWWLVSGSHKEGSWYTLQQPFIFDPEGTGLADYATGC